jgi:hypothetical protein
MLDVIVVVHVAPPSAEARMTPIPTVPAGTCPTAMQEVADVHDTASTYSTVLGMFPLVHVAPPSLEVRMTPVLVDVPPM